VRILLDTHLLLWALSEPRRLGRATLGLIERSEVHVSAASIWEIGIKAALGKLRADPFAVLSELDAAGFASLSISGEHAAQVHRLAPLHRDPFDRLLIAQAQVEAMTLVTNDELLVAYGDCVRLV
jgi:PIN domain nuclease of toxin-antitoxin system